MIMPLCRHCNDATRHPVDACPHMVWMLAAVQASTDPAQRLVVAYLSLVAGTPRAALAYLDKVRPDIGQLVRQVAGDPPWEVV